MFFIGLLAFITLIIAGSAAGFSVYGLANIFTGAFIPVIIMGSALEAGKLIAASFLYRYWDMLNLLMRTYLFSAIFILMVITSVGIFGFLSAAHQSDTLPLKEIEAKLELLKEEKVELKDRLKQIDDDIARIGANYISKRIELKNKYAPERERIDGRIVILTKDIRELTNTKIHQEVHTGPIIYIAKAFGAELDDATKWVILLLIFVFDPLAVVLTIGVNIAIAQRNEKKQILGEIASIDELKSKELELREILEDLQVKSDDIIPGLEDTVNELYKIKDEAHEMGENVKSDMKHATEDSIAELADHLIHLNDQAELTPEEIDEKIRIENLLKKNKVRERILQRVRNPEKPTE